MASKWPPLQLQFAVQGAKKLLLLNIENVACVFKTGVLTKKEYSHSALFESSSFGKFLGIPHRLAHDPLGAAAWWVRHGEDRRWKVIICYLDTTGETGIADELIPFSEPPSDTSLTIERVTPIFMNMRHWTRIGRSNYYYTIIPDARAEVIRCDYPSEEDQRRQGAIYYVNVNPETSWGHLARWLYYFEENSAMQALKAHLPKPKDPTLTVETMLQATEGVMMPRKSDVNFYLNIPDNIYNEIVRRNGTEKEGRRAVFSEFLSHHPYPRWEVVVQLLERLEKEHKAREGLAQEVKEKYLTSVRSLFILCVGHIVSNCEFYQPLMPQLPPRIRQHICSLPSWQPQETNM